MLSSEEKLRFWTAIMRDHGEFILTSLSYNEQDAIKTAAYYREAFSALHEQSKLLIGKNDAAALSSLIAACLNLLLGFINFKKLLLGNLLCCSLDSSLPPTFYNHMINEALEFYKTLCMLHSGYPVNPVLENLKLHKIWLPDAAGHAATIAGELDPVEKAHIHEAQQFEKSFNHLAIKADELEKMIERTCIEPNTLVHFNEEVAENLNEFICFLDKIRLLKTECKIMASFKPLVPFHMIREEVYYLQHITPYP